MNLSFDETEAYYRVKYRELQAEDGMQAVVDVKWLRRLFEGRLTLARDGDPEGTEHLRSLAETLVRHEPPGAHIADLLLRYAGTPEAAEEVVAAARLTADPVDVPDKIGFRDADGFVIETNGPNTGRRLADNRSNVNLALKALGARFRFDLFSQRKVLEIPQAVGPPFRTVVNDSHVRRVWFLVEEQLHFRPKKDFFLECVEDLAHLNAYHPVIDYLDPLVHDKMSRVGGADAPSWLTTYAGAIDSPYVRAIGRLMLVAAVRRVRKPGCMFQEMLVLESPQGQGKSSGLAVLAVNQDWFSDSLTLDSNTQRQMESIAGKWVVEISELKGISKAEIGALKGFLRRQVDEQRMAYGHEREIRPRQCVLFGTTNDEVYLRDVTGDRTIWPVKIEKFDVEALKRDRDQLWAEASEIERTGESIRLDPALYGDAAIEQNERRMIDPYEQVLDQLLGTIEGKLLINDVWTLLETPPTQVTQQQSARMGEAMRRLGWKRIRVRDGASLAYAYARGDKNLWVRPEGSKRVVNAPMLPTARPS